MEAMNSEKADGGEKDRREKNQSSRVSASLHIVLFVIVTDTTRCIRRSILAARVDKSGFLIL